MKIFGMKKNIKSYDDEYYSTGIDPYEPITGDTERCGWLLTAMIFLLFLVIAFFVERQ